MQLSITSRGIAVAAVAVAAAAMTYALAVPRAATAAPAPSSTPPPASPGIAGGITVSGSGRIAGTPNLLRLSMSVDVTEPSVDAALEAANKTAAAVQKSLRDHGVAPADLQTSGLSIQPSYDYSGNRSRLVGYQVSEQLSAVLRDLDKAGAAITAAANAGGNAVRINGAQLDLDGDSALVSQARQRAFDDAKAKAEQYAKAAGRKLGALVSVSESVASSPQPVYGLMSMPKAAASAVPIEAGSQDVTVTVAAVWSFA